jgi:flagellar motility protein MotE (MotC chaperone)
MTRKPKKRAGKGTLHIISGLLIASAVVRVGAHAGPARAESDTEIAEITAQEPQTQSEPGSLLAALQSREARLEEREAQLRNRMQALHVAEAEIDEKLRALVLAEEDLRATIALADTAAETDLTRLTTVYENMKPKEAAALFSEMPPQFAAGFLGMMRPDAAAMIMTELEPETAYSFSVVLAGRNANVPTQ